MKDWLIKSVWTYCFFPSSSVVFESLNVLLRVASFCHSSICTVCHSCLLFVLCKYSPSALFFVRKVMSLETVSFVAMKYLMFVIFASI